MTVDFHDPKFDEILRLTAQLTNESPDENNFESIITKLKKLVEQQHQQDSTEKRNPELDQPYLKILHELSIELTRINNLDEFFKQAVYLGITRLGFDRISLWLYNPEANEAQGTYSVDPAGHVQSESHIRFTPTHPGTMWQLLQKPGQLIYEDHVMLQHNLEDVGSGWKVTMALWHGDHNLGWLVVDNLITQQAVSPPQLEALAQYGMLVTALLAHKQAELRQQESEQMLQTVLDNIPIRVFWKDRNFRLLGCNKLFVEDTGFDSAEAIIGKTDEDLCEGYTDSSTSDALAQYWKDDERIIRTGEPIIGQEVPQIRKDVAPHWLHTNRLPLRNADGDIIGILGMYEDVTERRQIEQDLYITQFCVDNASIGILRTGPGAKIISANKHYCKMAGYTEEELCQLHIYDIDPNFPLETWKKHRKHIRENGTDTFETIHRLKDGTVIPVEVTTTYILFKGTEYSFSFIRDLSKHKELEKTLRLNSFVVEQVSDAVYWVDEAGIITNTNDAACQMTGYTRTELTGMLVTSLDAISNQVDVTANLDKTKNEGSFTFETKHKAKDGRVFPVEVMLSHISHEDVALNCAFVRDITERKRQENALKLNNFTIERISDAVYWLHKSQIIDVNEAACRMLGYSKSEFLNMSVGDIDIGLSPEHGTNIWERMRSEGSVNLETLHKTKDGVVIPVEIMMNYIVFDGKELNCCFVRDITERKEAESVLQMSEERLRQAVRAGNIGVFDHNYITNTIYMSPQHRRIYGWGSHQDITLDKFLTYVHPDDQKRVQEVIIKGNDPSGDGIIEVEHRIIDPKGRLRWVSVRSQTIFEGEGKLRRPVRNIGASVDVTERKQAEAKVQISEERLRQAVRTGHIGIFDLNHLENTIYWSQEQRKIWGWSKDEPVIAEVLVEAIHPEDRDRVLHTLANAYKPDSDGLTEMEHRIIDRAGNIRWLSVRTQTIFEGQGADRHPVRTIGATADITERKQIEHELRQGERRYRTLVESQVDMFSRYKPDTTLTFVNDAYCKFYGKTREEFTGQSFLHMVVPEFHEQTIKETEKIMRTAGTVSGEYLNYDADGNARWIQWIIQAIVDEHGIVNEIQAVGRDVTKLKETEAALRESEYFLKKSQTVAKIGSYHFDVKSGTWMNTPMLDELFGIDNDFTKNVEGWISLIHPDEREEMQVHLIQHVMRDHNRFDKQYRIIRHDNQEIHWVHGLGELEFDDDGNLLRMIGTIQDITERKEREAALKASRERLEQVTKATHIGIFEHDQFNETMYVSPEFRIIFGWDLDEVITADKFVTVTHPDDVEWVNQTVIQAHDPKSSGIYEVEHRIIRPNGQIRWVSIRSRTFFEGVGEARRPVRTIGATLDITERKESEVTLRVSEERLQQAVRVGDIGIFDNDLIKNSVFVSPELRKIYDWDETQAVSTEMFVNKVHPDDREWVTQEIYEALDPKGTGGFDVEHRITDTDANIRWVSTKSRTFFEGKGDKRRPVRTIGATADITERKQSEAALKTSEERLQQAIRVGNIGIFVNDLVNESVYVSPELRKVYGWEATQTVTLAMFIGKMHPEDKEWVTQEIYEALDPKGTGVFDVEHRILGTDGDIRWVNVKSQTFFDGVEETRRAIRTIGALADITERKLAETALQASEERLQQAIQVGNIGIFDHDQINETVYVSPELREIYNWDATQTVTLEMFISRTHPDDQEHVTEAIQRAHDPKSNGIYDIDHRIVGRNNEIRWVSVKAQTFFKGTGDLRHAVRTIGASADITEQKRAEEALRTSEVNLKEAQQIAKLGNFEFDLQTKKLSWSEQVYHIFEQPPGTEITFELYRQLLDKDTFNRVMQAVEQTTETKEPYQIEHSLSFDNGTRKDIFAIGRPILDDNGQVFKIFGIAQDITERKRIETALRESEAHAREFQDKLKALHEVSLELGQVDSLDQLCIKAIELGRSMLGYDRLGILMFENDEKSLVSRFGIESNGELMSQKNMDYDIKNDTLLAPTIASRDSILVSEDIELGDFEGKVGHGWNVVTGIWEANTSIGWIAADNYFCQTPLKPYQIELLRLYGLTIGHLMTRKQAEAAIQDLNDRLEQRVVERTKELEDANQEIRHFAYIVSHDLRAPLVNLKGFSGELRNAIADVKTGFDEVVELVEPKTRDLMMQSINEDIPEALRFIESSVENMDTFTKAILKLSRLGRLHLELTQINMHTVVQETLRTLAYQIDQQGIEVIVDDLPTIMADFVSMEQVFANILSNAVSYLDPERPGKIKISAERNEEETIFRVEDNGRGISEKDMDKVFAPFRRAGKQNVPGEGMGLAYVQTLIRRHGGHIECESKLGVGTTFTFTIPINLTNDTVGL